MSLSVSIRRRKGFDHVLPIPRSSKSHSSLLLLHARYMKLDLDRNPEYQLQKYLEFRYNFLNKNRTLDGKLVCSYCGRDDLIMGSKFGDNNRIRNLATIDHIMPLSRGGAKYDEDNCTVACKTCNRKKGNKIIT